MLGTMHTQFALPHQTLPKLQPLGAHFLTRPFSLSRNPDPSRVPQPIRGPDTPSRTHIPPRQPYPARQE